MNDCMHELESEMEKETKWNIFQKSPRAFKEIFAKSNEHLLELNF